MRFKNYGELASLASISAGLVILRIVFISPVAVLVGDAEGRIDYVLGALGMAFWVAVLAGINAAL